MGNRKYKCLVQQEFAYNNYAIVPIRDEDKYVIMQMRNEQIYHLRQRKPLIKQEQEKYFETTIANLFEEKNQNQILFSFLKNEECIGYGGLVHINWVDKHAEISFIIQPHLEKEYFKICWQSFLRMIERIAFYEMKLHKIFTYAFDLRPQLYDAVESCDFIKETVLKDHCYIENKFIDVVIHSKINANDNI